MKPGLEQLFSLQIMRGVAAASVAWLHTFTAPEFGGFGVDLFFVISGFVMCMIVQQSFTTPVDFMLTRIARIVPLYWAVTTMVLVTAWVAPNLMGTTSASIPNYLRSLFFIPHFRENGSLFPMLMPGWSLNYEMVFYATIFAVVAVHRALFFYAVSALLVLYFLVGALSTPGGVVHEFAFTTLWGEFILGMACYAVHRGRSRWLAWIPKPVVGALIVALFGVLIATEEDADRLWTGGLPSSLILLLSLQLEGTIRSLRAPVQKVLVHVGDASYATYLSHMFVIGFVERVLFAKLGIEKDAFTAVFTVVCCLAVGSLVYVFLDKPISAWSRRLAKRWALRIAPAPRTRTT